MRLYTHPLCVKSIAIGRWRDTLATGFDFTMMRMTDTERLLTTDDLAAFLDVPVKTLYAWRYRGEGPIGFRVGKHVRYRWTDVERWIRDRVQVAEKGRTPHHVRASSSATGAL